MLRSIVKLKNIGTLSSRLSIHSKSRNFLKRRPFSALSFVRAADSQKSESTEATAIEAKGMFDIQMQILRHNMYYYLFIISFINYYYYFIIIFYFDFKEIFSFIVTIICIKVQFLGVLS